MVKVSKNVSKVETRENLSCEINNAFPSMKEEFSGKCPIKISTDGEKIKNIEYKEPYKVMNNPFDSVLKHLTANEDYEIAREIFDRGIFALPNDKSPEEKISIILQSLANDVPKDPTEAKLCLQATALYAQGMKYLSRAESSERMIFCDFFMRNAIKLLKLHLETIEVLVKYRRGGEQKVVVQHVNVRDGGQAVVSGVLNSGGGNVKI